MALNNNTHDILPWQREIAAELATSKTQAILITGPRGIGKRTLACAMATQWILQRDSGSASYLESGNHPDLMMVEPAPESGSAGSVPPILIEQIRELQSYGMLTPMRSSRRICVIYPACRMNRNAANSLLKLLEEPPHTTTLLLVAHDPSKLPATILSRCRKVSAPVPTAEQSREWLESTGHKCSQTLLELYGNSPFRIFQLNDPSALDRLMEFLSMKRPEAIGEMAATLAKVRISDWMEWILKWTSDVVTVRFGLDPVHFHSMKGDIEKVSAQTGYLEWLDLQAEYAELNSYAAANLNAQLLAERVIGAYAQRIKLS